MHWQVRDWKKKVWFKVWLHPVQEKKAKLDVSTVNQVSTLPQIFFFFLPICHQRKVQERLNPNNPHWRWLRSAQTHRSLAVIQPRRISTGWLKSPVTPLFPTTRWDILQSNCANPKNKQKETNKKIYCRYHSTYVQLFTCYSLTWQHETIDFDEENVASPGIRTDTISLLMKIEQLQAQLKYERRCRILAERELRELKGRWKDDSFVNWYNCMWLILNITPAGLELPLRSRPLTHFWKPVGGLMKQRGVTF